VAFFCPDRIRSERDGVSPSTEPAAEPESCSGQKQKATKRGFFFVQTGFEVRDPKGREMEDRRSLPAVRALARHRAAVPEPVLKQNKKATKCGFFGTRSERPQGRDLSHLFAWWDSKSIQLDPSDFQQLVSCP
jgi:hypothetical protein